MARCRHHATDALRTIHHFRRAVSAPLWFLPSGSVPERPKGTGCKPVGYAYDGSNPSRPTIRLHARQAGLPAGTNSFRLFGRAVGTRRDMPSFDVVSEVDEQEVRNAVDQASRELTTRFDFKNTNSSV